MSYLHPTADVNSAGENPDPLEGDRKTRAYNYAAEANAKLPNVQSYNPFSSWKRVTEDLIHFTPFDSLPQEERDAIRARRRHAFENSAVPWIVTDYTSLMTAYDDVDDLLKTKTLIKDYAFTPAAHAVKALGKKRAPFRDEKLEGWNAACGVPVPPRQRKLLVPSFGGLNFLAQLGLGALGILFPSWRLASLLLQALQTTDSLFGIGIQLGPALGFAMEAAFRGLSYVGGAIFDFDNKFEQLKAARVMAGGNKALAAAGRAHPDDALTTLTGFRYASDADIVPQLVIDQDDYPSVSDVFENPWAIGKEGFDAARLALSLPYNLGALALNNGLGDALAGMSRMLGGAGDDGIPKTVADNETAALMKLAEEGICPGGQCEGELLMDAYLLAQNDGRNIPGEPVELSDQRLAKNLGLSVQDPQSLLPVDQTPVPR